MAARSACMAAMPNAQAIAPKKTEFLTDLHRTKRMSCGVGRGYWGSLASRNGGPFLPKLEPKTSYSS